MVRILFAPLWSGQHFDEFSESYHNANYELDVWLTRLIKADEALDEVWVCVAACCSVLQRVAACCSVLQSLICGSRGLSKLARLLMRYESVLQCVAVCCGAFQCAARCGGVLRCVAVCCRVCVAEFDVWLTRLIKADEALYEVWVCVAVCAGCCRVLQGGVGSCRVLQTLMCSSQGLSKLLRP